jgi:hypothetical protein
MSVFYRPGRLAHLQRLLNWAIHSLYIDAAHDARTTIFLCGPGRSGTTWLASLLNYDNAYRYLYEPFNRDQVQQCRHFFARQYLNPANDDPLFLEPSRTILTGKIRNAWIDQYNKRSLPPCRLVKDVRSSLMLKWIRRHFPEMPIIFLMRHPCAVALSRAQRAPMAERKRMFLDQSALVSDHLTPFVDLIEASSTPFERHLVAWCIENYVPLKQLRKGDVYLVYYELLCVDPAKELSRLFSFIGRPFSEAVLALVRQPSVTSRPIQSNQFLSGQDAVEAWTRRISADQISAYQRIASAFGLYEIYGSNTFPDAGKVELLMGAGETAPGASTRVAPSSVARSS